MPTYLVLDVAVQDSKAYEKHGARGRSAQHQYIARWLSGPCPSAGNKILFTPQPLSGAGGSMAKPSFVDQVATLNGTLNGIEEHLARGQAPIEGLEDFKSALDDVRLRLWGLLSAAGGDDYKGFQERFRIRRATEMTRGLGGDLRAGAINARHRELAGLKEAATELAQSIEQAQRQVF